MDMKNRRVVETMKTILRMTGASTAIFIGIFALAFGGCGELIDKTDSTGGKPSIRIGGYSDRTTDPSHPVIKANGTDTLLIVVEVTGLSQSIGFYVPAGFGTFLGPVASPDGFTYYNTANNGELAVTMISGTAHGTTNIQIASGGFLWELPLTVIQKLAIYPDTATLFGAGASITATTVGGVPPLKWFSTDPQLAVSPTNETDAVLRVISVSSGDYKATVTVVDAEGSTATLAVDVTAPTVP